MVVVELGSRMWVVDEAVGAFHTFTRWKAFNLKGRRRSGVEER